MADADRILIETMMEDLSRKQELDKILQIAKKEFFRKICQLSNAISESANMERELTQIIKPIMAEGVEDAKAIEALCRRGGTSPRMELLTSTFTAVVQEVLYLDEILNFTYALSRHELLRRATQIVAPIKTLLKLDDEDETNVVAICEAVKRTFNEIKSASRKLRNEIRHARKLYNNLLKSGTPDSS